MPYSYVVFTPQPRWFRGFYFAKIKSMIKNIIEAIISLVALTAIALGGAENADGSCQLAWTLSCIAVAALCGWLFGKLHPRPMHITDEAYIELQKQIQDAVDGMEGMDERRKTIEIEADLPDDAAIYLTIEMNASVSKVKFRDDAWGYDRTFTEERWTCSCEITKAIVLDGKGNKRESDFDELNLELEFEETEWK